MIYASLERKNTPNNTFARISLRNEQLPPLIFRPEKALATRSLPSKATKNVISAPCGLQVAASREQRQTVCFLEQCKTCKAPSALIKGRKRTRNPCLTTWRQRGSLRVRWCRKSANANCGLNYNTIRNYSLYAAHMKHYENSNNVTIFRITENSVVIISN